jgi:N-ethylmaleimide reductase
VDTTTPRALQTAESQQIVRDFRQAVVNARDAGFDMVELHGAHGYLVHHFLLMRTSGQTDMVEVSTI